MAIFADYRNHFIYFLHTDEEVTKAVGWHLANFVLDRFSDAVEESKENFERLKGKIYNLGDLMFLAQLITDPRFCEIVEDDVMTLDNHILVVDRVQAVALQKPKSKLWTASQLKNTNVYQMVHTQSLWEKEATKPTSSKHQVKRSRVELGRISRLLRNSRKADLGIRDLVDRFMISKKAKNAIYEYGMAYLNAKAQLGAKGSSSVPQSVPQSGPKVSSSDTKLGPLVDKEQIFASKLFTKFYQIEELRDGNCLFHACCERLNVQHNELREMVVNYMAERENEFGKFVEDNQVWTDYLAKMRQDRTWGGEPELRALSKLLVCPIAVLSKEYPGYDLNGKIYPNENCIYGIRGGEDIYNIPTTVFLYRIGQNHYNRLFLKD